MASGPITSWEIDGETVETRGVRPRLEGKQRTALSSRAATRISWSPLSRLKGIHPTLQFEERTRDCSPGQAGKEGPHLAMTGASHGFPQAAAPLGVFSRGTTRTSGPLPEQQLASCLKRNDYRAALHMLHLILSMSFLNSVGALLKVLKSLLLLWCQQESSPCKSLKNTK